MYNIISSSLFDSVIQFNLFCSEWNRCIPFGSTRWANMGQAESFFIFWNALNILSKFAILHFTNLNWRKLSLSSGSHFILWLIITLEILRRNFYVTRWVVFFSVGVGASQIISLSLLARNPHKGPAREISHEDEGRKVPEAVWRKEQKDTVSRREQSAGERAVKRRT